MFDIIGPLEVALLGLRCDGAQKLDPAIYVWAVEGEEVGAGAAPKHAVPRSCCFIDLVEHGFE
jgi:hypothetical protein